MLKRIFIGLFGISFTILLATAANARVCLFYQGGTCLFWSGSVECDLNANGVGNVKKDPKSLACNVVAQGTGLLLCGNPGSKAKAAPGIQVVTVPQNFGASTGITSVDKNGVATATVVTSANLPGLDEFCPNTNWVALDYVPCAASIEAELTDDIGTISSATFSCTLPSCETLGYDAATQKFERRQYECTRQ
ncbi:MAG: hypothetical protein AB7G75_06220 [Candidatus Binatia bacterium]